MTVRRLPRGFNLERWIQLTTRLTQENQILRAMYLRQDEEDPLSWVQVILRDPLLDLTIVPCHSEADRASLIQTHWNKHFTLGKPSVRYLILQRDNGTMDLVTKLDHAMYDGTLLRIFDDQFTALREGRPPTTTAVVTVKSPFSGRISSATTPSHTQPPSPPLASRNGPLSQNAPHRSTPSRKRPA
ncbi:hypothetical protein BJX61DRAFT_442783 [Aspergillus egyptiacus]|nr:hypothetical protein BJX61DRAFT_442783 [Aspergillus egyptiacus]